MLAIIGKQNIILKAAFLVVFAVTLIVIGDTAGKQLTQLDFDPMFIAWSRFALAALLMLPFCGLKREELRHLINWRILLRSLLIVSAISFILTALKTEQIANVFGAIFVGPIVAYFLSATLLKEHITFVRSTLLLISFIGVLLVVKPGFGISTGIGFALLAGCCHGSYLAATKWLAQDYRPRFLLISQLIVGAIILLPFNISKNIDATLFSLEISTLLLILISAMGSAMGNLLIALASRTTPASIIAPLIYSQILAATIVGYYVYGDLPDIIGLLGLFIILFSGMASLWFARKQ